MMKIILSFLVYFFITIQCFAGADDLKITFDKDDPAYVDLLIKSGKGLHFTDSHDRTLLHTASEKGKINIAKKLIEKGADVNSKDMINWTPLHYASWRGNVDIVKLLIKKGADVDAKGGKSAVSGIDYNLTSLQIAARNDHFEVVNILTNSNADIDSKDFENKTALHEASYRTNKEIVKFLLSKGADPNIYSKNKRWPTPLFLAIGCGSIKTAKLLIDNGADVFAKNEKGETPYDFVVRLKRHKEASFLKEIMDVKKKDIETDRIAKQESRKQFVNKNKYILYLLVVIVIFFGFMKLKSTIIKKKNGPWTCHLCNTENTEEHLQCWKCGKNY